jgi:hypothetical protein
MGIPGPKPGFTVIPEPSAARPQYYTIEMFEFDDIRLKDYSFMKHTYTIPSTPKPLITQSIDG